jgi:hypothetical protein
MFFLEDFEIFFGTILMCNDGIGRKECWILFHTRDVFSNFFLIKRCWTYSTKFVKIGFKNVEFNIFNYEVYKNTNNAI